MASAPDQPDRPDAPPEPSLEEMLRDPSKAPPPDPAEAERMERELRHPPVDWTNIGFLIVGGLLIWQAFRYALPLTRAWVLVAGILMVTGGIGRLRRQAWGALGTALSYTMLAVGLIWLVIGGLLQHGRTSVLTVALALLCCWAGTFNWREAIQAFRLLRRQK